MGGVAELAVGALEPFVGRMAADTCVRATAISAGKMADELCGEDMPVLEVSIRRLLQPIATTQTIDTILGDIRQGAEA